MKEIKLIIVGFGNIGKGLAESIHKKGRRIKQCGYSLKVVAICEAKGSLIDEKGLNLEKILTNPVLKWGKMKTVDVIHNVNADIVLELTPGNIETGEPGLTHIMEALKSKKHVVTSNKSPIAVAYDKLMKTAEKNNVKLLFEATVGGAIPAINTFKKELVANTPKNIYGIMNGTTNFILSKMSEEGVNFNSALAEAQELGFAESDPTYDIKGIDSAVKVVILAHTLFDKKIKISSMDIEGIDRITSDSIELAKNHGYDIRLVGDVAAGRVSPVLVPRDHPLNVGGNLNAIMVETDLAKQLTIIGHGAGPKQTSSAILSDIISIYGG